MKWEKRDGFDNTFIVVDTYDRVIACVTKYESAFHSRQWYACAPFSVGYRARYFSTKERAMESLELHLLVEELNK